MDTVTSHTDTPCNEQIFRLATCPTHGPYRAKVFCFNGKEIPSGCPECLTEKQKEADERKKQKLQVGIEVARRKTGIPKRFITKRLDCFVAETSSQKKNLDYSVRYLNTWPERLAEGDSLIFYGNAGSGKTHLACGIANGVVDQGGTVSYLTTYDLVRRVKETWGKNSEQTEASAITQLLQPDLLIIDEVGVQFGTDAEKLVLFDVINKRYSEMRPMILISNLRIEDMEEYLGSRVIDRFYEGKSRAVPFPDTSWRRRGELAQTIGGKQ